MAAVITVSAVTVAADGKTVTATLAGGTGTGYAISNTTGLSVTWNYVGADHSFPVSSASVSGTTLTVNLSLPTGAGETIRFTIATSATITDSGANTPQGQSLLAVTNNSAVTVYVAKPYIDYANIELGGHWTPQGTAPNQTVNSGTGQAWASQAALQRAAEFVVNCTDVGVLVQSALTSTANVDTGASFTVPADTANGRNVKPVATGLAAGDHLIRVDPGSAWNGFRISGGTRAFKSVTPLRRTIAPSTTAHSNPDVPDTTEVTPVGTWYPMTGGNGVAGSDTFVGFSVEFQFSGTGVDLQGTTQTIYAIEVDGVPQSAMVNPNVGNFNDWQTLVAGLTPGTHTIKVTTTVNGTSGTYRAIRIVNGTTSTNARSIGDTTIDVGSTALLAVGDWVKIDSLTSTERRQIQSITGSTVTLASALSVAHAAGVPVTSYSAPKGTITTWTKKTRTKRVLGIGDSNTRGANPYGFLGTPDANGIFYSQYDPRQSGIFRGADALNFDFLNHGIQGSTAANIESRSTLIPAYSRGVGFDRVVIWIGTNDINGTTISPATYQSQVQTVVTTALANLTADGYVVLLPPGTPVGGVNANGLSYATCLAAMQSIAAGSPSRIRVATNLYDALVSGDYDGLHYKESGAIKIGAALQPYLIGGEILASSAYLAA